jgi:hypothetical protein
MKTTSRPEPATLVRRAYEVRDWPGQSAGVRRGRDRQAERLRAASRIRVFLQHCSPFGLWTFACRHGRAQGACCAWRHAIDVHRPKGASHEQGFGPEARGEEETTKISAGKACREKGEEAEPRVSGPLRTPVLGKPDVATCPRSSRLLSRRFWRDASVRGSRRSCAYPANRAAARPAQHLVVEAPDVELARQLLPRPLA